MRRRGLSSLLDPFGPLNPLHPRNPLSPIRAQALSRCPPPIELGEEHDSVMAKLYGGGALRNLPFPNMEWWWNAIECQTSMNEHFSILTNVHLFALPHGGWTAQGTIAVRDLVTKRGWQATTSGTLDPGRSCRFTAHGWHLYRNRATNTYHVEVYDDDIQIKLAIPQGKVAYFDDLPKQTPANRAVWGWFDNNPSGNIPYWASYRSRFTATPAKGDGGAPISGELRLPDHRDAVREIVTGSARFDHQSLHWSIKDAGGLTPGVLGEVLLTRPQWLWYHLKLDVDGQPLNLLAYEIRNGHTGVLLKKAAALSGDDDIVASIDPDTLVFNRSDRTIAGRVSAPRRTTIEFFSRTGVWGKVHFKCRENQGWTVRYPIAGQIHYDAEEVLGDVSGEVKWLGERKKVTGSGTLEVLDMLASVSV